MASRARITLLASLVAAAFVSALALLALTPMRAAAVEPIDLRDVERDSSLPIDPETLRELLREVTSTPPPAPSPTPRPTPAATPDPTPTPSAIGYDISYPQCGDDYPESFSFAIVGVNGGRVHSENPCLGPGDHASQLEWAGEEVELYANTGNPGPQLSRYWPRGQTEPQPCDTRDAPGADTLSCAYDYGWNAAEHAYETALEAAKRLGLVDEDADRFPEGHTWWLDVEDANSWRGNRTLNVAALQGAVDHLEAAGAEEVGFYSTPRLWDRITGGTDVFAEHPSWHAGASDEADARDRCDGESFTGGELRMVQWVEDGLDHNVRCG